MAFKMQGHIMLSTRPYLCSDSTHPLCGSVLGLRIKYSFDIVEMLLARSFLTPQLEVYHGDCKYDAQNCDFTCPDTEHLRTIYRLIHSPSSH